MKKSSLHLDDETHAQLHALRAHYKCSVQDVIRRGIQQLHRQEIETPTVPSPSDNHDYEVLQFMQRCSQWLEEQKKLKGSEAA